MQNLTIKNVCFLGKLTPNYDAPGDAFKLFKMGKNLTLQCKPENAADGGKIVWLVNIIKKIIKN